MNTKYLVKKVLKETFYNYSFSTDLKDINEQKIQQEFINLIQKTNEKIKEKGLEKFKFRQKKNSNDMFIWIGNEKSKIIKEEELKPFYNKILHNISRKQNIKEEEVKRFLNKNEEDSFEYLQITNWLLNNKNNNNNE